MCNRKEKPGLVPGFFVSRRWRNIFSVRQYFKNSCVNGRKKGRIGEGGKGRKNILR